MTNSPIYLLASERSGTNLLRRRLTQHNNIYFGPPPAHFLKHLYYQEPYYGNLEMDENFQRMVADALDLCSIHFSPWELNVSAAEVIDKYSHSKRNSILLSDFLLQMYAEEKGYKSYFCKDNFIYEFASAIENEIPTAKFIYLYRDPRDYVLSQLKRPSASSSVIDNARLWEYEQTKCISIAYKLRGEGRCYWLPYESLIDDEDKILKELCEFLNINYIEKRKEVIEHLDEDIPEWSNLYEKTIKGNYYKYRKELTSAAIYAIEKQCGKQMKLLGYEREEESKKLYLVYLVYSKIIGMLSKLKLILRSTYRHRIERGPVAAREGLAKRLHNNYRRP